MPNMSVILCIEEDITLIDLFYNLDYELETSILDYDSLSFLSYNIWKLCIIK